MAKYSCGLFVKWPSDIHPSRWVTSLSNAVPIFSNWRDLTNWMCSKLSSFNFGGRSMPRIDSDKHTCSLSSHTALEVQQRVQQINRTSWWAFLLIQETCLLKDQILGNTKLPDLHLGFWVKDSYNPAKLVHSFVIRLFVPDLAIGSSLTQKTLETLNEKSRT